MLDPEGTSQVDPEWEILNKVFVLSEKKTCSKLNIKQTSYIDVPEVSKLNNKNMRTKSKTSSWCTIVIFNHSHGINFILFVSNFEHIIRMEHNISWKFSKLFMAVI